MFCAHLRKMCTLMLMHKMFCICLRGLYGIAYISSPLSYWFFFVYLINPLFKVSYWSFLFLLYFCLFLPADLLEFALYVYMHQSWVMMNTLSFYLSRESLSLLHFWRNTLPDKVFLVGRLFFVSLFILFFSAPQCIILFSPGLLFFCWEICW